MKKRLLIDFDGVIHSYITKWNGGLIVDPPMENAFEMLSKYLDNFSVWIFSTRCETQVGIEAIKTWFINNDFLRVHELKYTYEKLPAHLLIDDRSFQFKGVFPTVEEINNFEPYKQGEDNLNILYIIRGLPGSGKTTLAKKIAQRHIEADMFHILRGEYNFDYDNLSKAHDWCRLELERMIRSGINSIAVSNTFSRESEFIDYIELADKYDYSFQVITIEASPFGSEHNVPEEVIQKMIDRWEPYLKGKKNNEL